MIIINKSGNWSYPYDFKGRGELADSRELIFKKSKSEPFLLLEHPPSPNPITLPIVYPQGARANLIETAFPNCKKVYFSRLKSARWLISTTYFMYCIRKKKKNSWAWDQLKTKNLSAEDLKNAWAQWVKLEPAIRSIDAYHRITCFDTSYLITTWMWNIIPKKPCTSLLPMDRTKFS